MKLIIQIVVTALLGLILVQFLPWWSIAIAGVIGGLSSRSNLFMSFLGGFLGIFLLWSLAALLILWGTESPLPDRVGDLMPLKMDGTGLAFFSGLIGGLVAGFAALTGRILRGKK